MTEDLSSHIERCVATSRKTGERCTAYPVRGRDQCAGHLGLGKLDQKKASARSAEVRHQRSEMRKAGINEVAAAQLERNADKLIRVFLDAAREGDWRAADALWTRVYGKPLERTQTTATDVDVSTLTPEQRDELRRELLKAHPHLRAV